MSICKAARVSHDPIRRRRLALSAAALAALALGVAVGGASNGGGAPGPATTTTTPSPKPPSLPRQVGDVLIIAFQGTTAPAYVLEALHDHRAAGVILFGRNAADAASVKRLTAQLQRAAGGDAIVCLDQEGGSVRTLAFEPSEVGQAGQHTPAAAAAAASATARALRSEGVNVVLGPVADVAAGTPGSFMRTRAYPGGPAAVAANVRAAVAAYAKAGIATTLKHFPGLGAATVNTDDGSAAVPLGRAKLLASLAPYATSTPLVMVSHARYPALDPDRIASQSPRIIGGLLRGQLHFKGVVITDSLEAQASLDASGGDVGRAAVRSLAAGADLLLATGRGSFLPIRRALLAAARRSPSLRARLTQSEARVNALRSALR